VKLPLTKSPYLATDAFEMEFPTRAESCYHGISDCVLMTSRDGRKFHRWNGAFIRPGPQPARWGIVTTKSGAPDGPAELSLYATEGYYHSEGTRLRRYSVRRDGFVSVNAPAEGGEMVTKPLVLNFRKRRPADQLCHLRRRRVALRDSRRGRSADRRLFARREC
jgi:hypothetical protein